MAITQNTLIGRSKNKVGGTVFTKWKGRNVLKAKPLTVANPQTSPQMVQRGRQSLTVFIGRIMLTMIRTGFQEFSSTTSQWAKFIQKNIIDLWTWNSNSPPTFNATMSALKISQGTLEGVVNLDGGGISDRVATVTWDNNTGTGNASATDKISLAVAVIPNSQSPDSPNPEVYVFPEAANRSAGTTNITIPGSTTVSSFSCYAFFSNSSSRLSSDTAYLTALS